MTAAVQDLTTNEERRDWLVDVFLNRTHPVHTDLHLLLAQVRQDPHGSRALVAAVGALAGAATSLSDCLRVVTTLLDEQAAAKAEPELHEPTD